MPRRHRDAKRRSAELTDDQYWELLLGDAGVLSAFTWVPGTKRSPGVYSDFESPQARETAWYLHRDWMMANEGAGQRPWAWWCYEAGLAKGERQPCGGHRDEVWLLEHNKMDREEMAGVLADLQLRLRDPDDPENAYGSEATRADWRRTWNLAAALRAQLGITGELAPAEDAEALHESDRMLDDEKEEDDA
ncbi:MAG: hypothetical protein DLM54_04660 [Acidimicrobiales bacterium]|nr:MAG: hypothetical protein DLM54_04660 [Acidimicrobiales bacterium]